MKITTTQITILAFLFLFPSVSFSQTFKCEFMQEDFLDGRSNESSCSGTPESVFGLNYSRTQHCKFKDIDRYTNYSLIADLKTKKITYSVIYGNTRRYIEEKVAYHKNQGDMDKHEVRQKYSKIEKYDYISDILSAHPFVQIFSSRAGDYGDVKSTSHLITFKRKLSNPEDESLFTVYIPENGKSIMSEYVLSSLRGENSWLNMNFGKCVKTSD